MPPPSRSADPHPGTRFHGRGRSLPARGFASGRSPCAWSAGGLARDAIARLNSVLDKARPAGTALLNRGRDIAAACGQLAAAS